MLLAVQNLGEQTLRAEFYFLFVDGKFLDGVAFENVELVLWENGFGQQLAHQRQQRRQMFRQRVQRHRRVIDVSMG